MKTETCQNHWTGSLTPLGRSSRPRLHSTLFKYRTRDRFLLSVFLVAMALGGIRGSDALAATPFFEEHFDTNVLNPNLQDPDNAFIIEAGSIHRAGTIWERHNVRTIDSDYMSRDFVAEVSLSIDQDILFFGIGSGVPDCENFCEPFPSILMRMHGIGGEAMGQIHAGVFPHSAFDPSVASSFYFISTNGGFHRARITKQGATITFAFDENYRGAFVPDAAYALTNVLALAPWLNNTNSRIFFGAGNTVDIFDDLVVRGLELNVDTEPAPLTENSGVPSIRLERLLGVDQPASIAYGVTGGTATPGVDFVLTNSVLNFAAGVTNLAIPLTIVDDALVEGPETIILGFTNSAAGWTNQVSLTILDDDTGIELERAAYSVSEDAGQLVLGVRRQDDSPETATVNFTTVDGTATAGQDYTAMTGTLNFAPGETHKEIVVPIIDDALREPAESFIVRLANAAGGSSLGGVTQATVTIQMSDPATLHVWLDSPNPIPPYLTWATAATNIQDAVDAALPGETVLVTNGVYATGGRTVVGTMTNRVAVDKPLIVRSVNGPQSTVIKGHQVPDIINGEGAIRCVYLTSGASLSGFTLTNGATLWNSSGDTTREESGGGVWCESPSALVSNCVVAGNSASHYGGGVFGGMLNNCTLSANSGGINGGGAHSSTLINCTLAENSAGHGGGAHSSMLNNCTLTGNTAIGGGSTRTGFGGGANWSTLNNCTLAGNSAGGGGGAAYSTLNNCIVYFNSPTGSANYLNSTLNYCSTTPMPIDGVGNIAADPQLASATHISSTSPCIGAGSANYATGVDIDGEPWANPPCIGADQLTTGSATGGITVRIRANYANVAVGFVVSLVAEVEGRLLRSVWDFGDGTSTTNQPFVSHAWDSPGVYSVKLTAYNDSHPDGVSAIKTIYVWAQDAALVYYVNQANPNPAFPYTSWASAATSIQEAIDAVVPGSAGNLVLVTNGTYATGGRAVAGSTIMNRVAVDKPLALRSVNGPELTFIQGSQAPGGGNGDGAIRCVYLTTDASMVGFTLTNGATRTGWDPGLYYPETSGGGVWCESGGAVVSNCVITGNSASSYGGGAYRGTLSNCALSANSAEIGGGAADSTLNDCTLASNSGGGAWGVLRNCVVTGNDGSSGGEFYNCTVVGNNGAVAGTAFNSILYYNTGRNYEQGTILNYCCTTPMPSNGVGNITNEPAFMDLAAGDFRLRVDSPSIDAGTNLAGIITTDILGLPRPMDGNNDGVARFDIGAYELNPYRFEPALQIGVDGFQFTVRGEPGRWVRIERSRDLVHWEFAGEVPIPASGQTLIDPAATSEPRLFYRVMRVP
ncbi:MAG TPA: Calx-beta domain-containing protein [Verrucomicrobiae bacterium]